HGQTVFIVGGPSQQNSSACLAQAQHRRLIASDRLAHRRPFPAAEPAARIVSEHGDVPALAAADDKVIPTISIEIAPTDARSQLTEFPGQKRLESVVVERLVLVNMVEK